MALVDYGSSSEESDAEEQPAAPRKTLLGALPPPKAKAAEPQRREAPPKIKRKLKTTVLGDIAAKRAALLSVPDAPVRRSVSVRVSLCLDGRKREKGLKDGWCERSPSSFVPSAA